MVNFNPELDTGYEDETRKKYRELAKQMHPDRGGSEEKMKELNAAYEAAKQGNFIDLEEMYSRKGRVNLQPDETKSRFTEEQLATFDERNKTIQENRRRAEENRKRGDEYRQRVAKNQRREEKNRPTAA